MLNLRQWIEAQLKRGYSRKQIKSALIRKGYSLKAVAEVDKIAYTVPPAKTLADKKIPKKFSSKTIALISIVIGVVVLVWLFNALPFFSKQSSENIAAGQKSAKEINIDDLDSIRNRIASLCGQYEQKKEDCIISLQIVAERYGKKAETIQDNEDSWTVGLSLESGYKEVIVKNKKIVE